MPNRLRLPLAAASLLAVLYLPARAQDASLLSLLAWFVCVSLVLLRERSE